MAQKMRVAVSESFGVGCKEHQIFSLGMLLLLFSKSLFLDIK